MPLLPRDSRRDVRQVLSSAVTNIDAPTLVVCLMTRRSERGSLLFCGSFLDAFDNVGGDLGNCDVFG